MLSFDPTKPAEYPNGRVFTDDVINYRLAFLTKNECPPTGLKLHTDVLKVFPIWARRIEIAGHRADADYSPDRKPRVSAPIKQVVI